MRPLRVVAPQPVGRQRAHLLQRVKEVRVEHFFAISPVEAFDVGVLIRFAGLDEAQGDGVRGGPDGDGLRDELRAVIQSYGIRGPRAR